ncbi:MAG: sugar phosphate isomerase/epimerase [Clostridia bacterium]|nr:sugar phosphate isomerase/epimerase [Clostridia bacterium]
MRLPVSIQLFSFRDDLENDARSVFKALSEMGYEGIEPYGGKDLYGYSLEEFKSMMDELGLKVPSAHITYDTLMRDPDDTLSFHKALGCQYLAIPFMVPEKLPGGSEYEGVAENIDMLCSKAQEYGITLCYHNHEGEFKKIGDKYIMDLLLEDIPALKAEFDTAWMAVMNQDPAEYMLKYKGRCGVVHIKDFYREKDVTEGRGELRPVGYGIQKMPHVIDAAKEAGAAWLVVEQDNAAFGLSNLECAKMSIEYLKWINR